MLYYPKVNAKVIETSDIGTTFRLYISNLY
jgi:hypothetical protein